MILFRTNSKHTEGFTLIELLVVIAIIGLLSSVVLASLSSAREKARLGAVRQEMTQMRSVMNLHYNSSSGYTPLRSLHANQNDPYYGVWIMTQGDCDYSYGPSSIAATTNGDGGVAAAQMLLLCKKIISLVNSGDSPTLHSLIIGGTATKYSITVIPRDSASYLYCIGTTGVTFVDTQTTIPGATTAPGNQVGHFNAPGCYYTVSY